MLFEKGELVNYLFDFYLVNVLIFVKENDLNNFNKIIIYLNKRL